MQKISRLVTPREPTYSAQPAGFLYALVAQWQEPWSAGSSPVKGKDWVAPTGESPAQAKRDSKPKRCKQSGKPIRSAARWQTATGLCEPEKVCPHSEVRNQTSTANSGAGINTAEHRRTVRYTKRQLASPVRTIQGIKKALRTCSPQRVRPAQHTPVGRVRGILRYGNGLQVRF